MEGAQDRIPCEKRPGADVSEAVLEIDFSILKSAYFRSLDAVVFLSCNRNI